MAKIELKPCPFCGSTNIKIYSNGQAIYCEDCSAGVEEYGTPPEKLIQDWNKRAYKE